MAIEVPREYVLQQLKSMGIREVTDEELNSYTRDFSHLVRGHVELSSSPSTASDSSSLAENALLQDGRHTSQISLTSLTSSSLSSADHTPFPTAAVVTPQSAVFKGPKVKEGRTRRKPVKRKVLRKYDGESRVFDESLNESGQSQDDIAGQESDFSLSSVSSTKTGDSESDVRLYFPSSLPQHSNERRHKLHCCKSFIRPPTAPPHLRGLKKCDPVQRYHEFRQMWETHQPPGEKNRNSLRCHIREQLRQDLPYFEAPQRVYKPNEFVVPTDKKRSSLRWHIRHTLAHQ